jgi:photosystem II protein PsbQ
MLFERAKRIEMGRFRPILGILLAIVATCLVACGGPAAKVPTTYTPDILQKVELYSPGVAELRERFPELEQSIQEKDWVDVQSFIHGPMGELRSRVNRLAATLLVKDQNQAEALAKELYVHLERLDEAAQQGQQVIAGQEYRNALDDFDSFLSIVPTFQ